MTPAVQTVSGGKIWIKPSALARAMALVEAELDTVTSSQMAAAAGLGLPHFRLVWKLTRGDSPKKYIMSKRLEKVQELLRTTGLTLPQIASDCGFCSGEHLAFSFKARFGMTPSQWRQRTSPK
jgi:transcriptional regulator GlxA family with amidase domain